MQDIEKEVKKRLKDGWIKALMYFEVLALDEKFAKEVLESHLQKLEKLQNVLVYKKEFGDVKKVESPAKPGKVGYSTIVKVEFIAASYEALFYVTINFGPSSVEILEPQTIKLDLWQAQGVLNSVSEMMHKFAAQGAGGIILQKV
ncbi:MAG TPA: hypothetical protein VJA47_04500 [archaeon]|nr:hypothetical protein [archaeon]